MTRLDAISDLLGDREQVHGVCFLRTVREAVRISVLAVEAELSHVETESIFGVSRLL